MKILVIDNEPAMTELLKLLLAQTSPSVITAENGKEGIRLVEEEQPDLVILDLMMPEMDGKEVCREVRVFSQVPILILSAVDAPGKVAETLDAGADDYLIKPVSSVVLIAHINKLLRRLSPEWAQLCEARAASQ